MYRCGWCGRFFDEPTIVKDDPSPVGVSLASGYYAEPHCPFCDSESVEEAGECVSCGEPVEIGQTLCENCREDLKSYMSDVATAMHIPMDMMEEAIEEINW
jgi:hypothetical protein